MTNKVQWKVLPTKANRDMEQAGAEAAREYLERTGHNNLWVIYEAMVAAAPAAPTAQHEPKAEPSAPIGAPVNTFSGFRVVKVDHIPDDMMMVGEKLFRLLSASATLERKS
jgi:hypothetical protein